MLSLVYANVLAVLVVCYASCVKFVTVCLSSIIIYKLVVLCTIEGRFTKITITLILLTIREFSEQFGPFGEIITLKSIHDYDIIESL